MTKAAKHTLLLLAICAVTTQSVNAQLIPVPPKAAADVFLPDPATEFLDYSQSWPARWGSEKSSTRGVIVPLSSPASTFTIRRISSSSSKTAADEIDFAALSTQFPGLTQWTLEGANATPVESRINPPPFLRTGTPEATMVFKFVSGTVTRRGDIDELVLERTTFALYDPIGSDATHIVVLLPGMFGTPEQVLEPLIFHLRSQGIAVVRMFSHPSRFTEQLSLTIDPNNNDDLEANSKRIANTVNSRIAECAYAVDAAIQHIIRKSPALGELPRVALGASGGAIALPTVCALHPDTWAGAILIGGGADFWLINQRSNYQNLINALKVQWTTEPSQAQRQSFDNRYLQLATLDPFHTAKCLATKPVLYLRGENDQAVPATLGELLWTRIATTAPDSRKISTPLTHEALFATLPARFDELSDWIKARKR